MAKRRRRRTRTEQRIEGFAEDLGRLLGTARAKADSWLSQRQQITKQLLDIRNTATKLLADLGQHARTAMNSAVSRAPATALVRERPKQRRKMSAAARAKIAAAQRRRWARQKRAAASQAAAGKTR
jgi:hypothetical protein